MKNTLDSNAAVSPSSDSPAPRSWAKPVLRGLAWIAACALAASALLLIVVALALAVAYPNLPPISGLTDYRPKLPLRIMSSDGVLLAEFGEERRRFTPIGQIPKVMQDAVLAIEDARFYRHGGVDYLGIVRAGLAQFNRAKSQGASTITMQVARNFYLSTEKTFTRKIYEILLAMKIESQLGKEQILEVYMNQIFLGHRAYGFAAASEIYFGKPLKDVTVAEAAMLAGLPQAPSAYNPISNPQRATRRQQHIIQRMLDNQFITVEQAEVARKQELTYKGSIDTGAHAEYVAETVRQLIQSQYGDETTTRGLVVHVTIDSADQLAAYRALRRGLMNYERRQIYRGPEAYVDLPTDPKDLDLRIAEALADHPDNDELRSAVVLEASPKKVLAVLDSGDTITIVGSGLQPVASGLSDKAGPKIQIRRGAVVRAIQGTKGEWILTQQPEVEGGFVSIEPATGAVKALVGGFDFEKNKFNHVVQAWRQPGSSFKPFIYSAGLEKGFTPHTVVNDAPLFFDAGATGSQPWEPKNYDGKFEGPMPLKQALARSKNMVSIRVLQAVGVHTAQAWATRFGFDADKHPAYLTMALGAGSVTPLQMASAYSVFANGGYRLNPVLVTRVTDNQGRVLQQTRPVVLNESMRAIDARNAFVMTQLLGEVTRAGTAASVQQTFKRPDLYGKTGTTNDSLDAWFAGYHRDLAAVVWIGYDTPRKLGDNETGGGLSLPVWIDYMRHALNGVPVHEYPVPEGLINLGDEWYYDEYAHGTGVSSVGLEDKIPSPPAAPNEEERKSILDMFRR